MANYGIIYSSNTGMVRRMIVSDDPMYDFSGHVGSGESLLVADKKNGSDVFAARAAVEAATGKPSPDYTCAIVDKNGAIVSFVQADPTLDVHPDGALVAVTPDVTPDATYDANTKMFTIPERIIPAGVDKSGKPVDEVVIPETTSPAIDVAAIAAASP